MKLHIQIRLALLALLPALFVAEYSVAQAGFVVVEGQQKSLAVIPNAGDTYVWRIYKKPTFLSADLAGQSEVEYDVGAALPVLPVLWKRQGDYYYIVTVFNSKGCKNMKAGNVKVISPPVYAYAGKDSMISVCSKLVLDASKSAGEGLTYRWDLLDPGGTLSSDKTISSYFSLAPGYNGTLPASFRIMLSVTNKYSITATDTIVVTVGTGPVAGILHQNSPNKDGSMVIDGTASKGEGLTYLWSTAKGEIVGDPNKPQVLIKGAGIYSLEVTDVFGCKSMKSFQFPFPLNYLIANADYVRTSWVDSIRIHVLNNDYDSGNDMDKSTLSILRMSGSGTTFINKDGSITYSPTMRKPGMDMFVYQICDSAGVCDTAKVIIDIIEGQIWIPEAISPNGDGSNERFFIHGLESYVNSSLIIYSRSGQIVYKSMEYRNDWAGDAKNSAVSDGTRLPVDTYYYVLHLGGTNRYIKGFVYLSY